MSFTFVDFDRYRVQVLDVIGNGIEENLKYVAFITASNSQKLVFWRTGDKIFGELQKLKDGEYEKKMNLYIDLTSNDDCFKILPEGCTYSGQANDFYSSICKGYETLPLKIHEGLIKLSVNVEEVNPETTSRGFAECIKKNINTFSIKMQCAVEGMTMDHSWAVNKLEESATYLRNEGYINVVVDPDTLSITYDEQETETVRVEETAEDHIA